MISARAIAGAIVAALAAAGFLVVSATTSQRASASTTTYSAQVLADGPASYWRLDEVSSSVAGDARSRRPGSYRGSPTLGVPAAVDSEPGNAVSFDGVDDAVRIPSAPTVGPSRGITVELWVRRAKSGKKQILVQSRRGITGGVRGYMVWIDSSDRVRATFAGGNDAVTLTSRAALDTNWHHIVASYGGGTARLFVDAVRNDRQRKEIRLVPGTHLRFGASAAGRRHFGGTLDEIAVYRSVLSRTRIEAHFRASRAEPMVIGGPPPPPSPPGDVTPPTVGISVPVNGATLTTPTPTISGVAGIAPGDLPTVTVRVYSGASATGIPVRTLAAVAQSGGAYAVAVGPALSVGPYTARASQADSAGNVGLSAPRTFTVALGSDPVLIGAGDIAGCGMTPKDAETAALLAAHPTATVFTLGDNAYDNGTLTEFQNCYGPTWGAHKARTRPTVADHELDTGSPSGYLTYFNAQLAPFGSTATDPTKMYYSYNLGAWHVVHLNSACFFYTPGCDVAGQENWFRADLAANPRQCTAVMLHSPRFSSGNIHSSNPDMQNLWAIAYQGGVELVLSGDDHIYERFAPMNASGAADPNGVVQMIAGTGGYLQYGIGTIKTNSLVRYTANPGVLRLTLHASSYDTAFLPITGGTIDAQSASCH